MSTSKKSAATDAVEQVEAAVAVGRENIETMVKAGSDAAAKNYEKAVAMGREQIEAAFDASAGSLKSVKGYEEFAAFGKDNMDAAIEAGNIFAKGMQDINKAWFGFTQASVDTSIAVTKQVLGCKNIEDAVAAQTAFATDGYNDFVTKSGALSDLSAKTADKAMQPIVKRVDVMIEKFTKPLTA